MELVGVGLGIGGELENVQYRTSILMRKARGYLRESNKSVKRYAKNSVERTLSHMRT